MTSLVGYDYDSDDSDQGERGAQEPAEGLAQAGPPQRAEAEGSGAAEFGGSAKASVGSDSRQLLLPDKSAPSNASGQGKGSSQRVGAPSKPLIQQLPANQPPRVILPSAADLLGDSPDSLSFAIGTAGRGGPSGRLQGPAEIAFEADQRIVKVSFSRFFHGRGKPHEMYSQQGFGNMPGGVGAGSGGMAGYGGGLGGAAAPGGGGGGSGGFGPGGAGAGAPGGGAAGAGGPPGVGGVGSIPAGGAGAGSGFPAGAAPPGAQGMGGMGAADAAALANMNLMMMAGMGGMGAMGGMGGMGGMQGMAGMGGMPGMGGMAGMGPMGGMGAPGGAMMGAGGMGMMGGGPGAGMGGGAGMMGGRAGARQIPVVKLRGLPFRVEEGDVADFFAGLEIVDILFVRKEHRLVGEAFVLFASTLHSELALQRNKMHMGRRYIEVFRAKKAEFYNAIANEVAQDGGTYHGGGQARESSIVKMRGLPFSATTKDILEFFGEYPLADAAVHIITNSIGRLTGEAFVEFGSVDEARAALGKDRERMGTRYIELYLSSRDEATRIATRASTQR
ncbi:unnamed protein product [Closterium sp. Yama58-4]|nr:unnamed protein product [Closterium sp. Yama58-4]